MLYGKNIAETIFVGGWILARGQIKIICKFVHQTSKYKNNIHLPREQKQYPVTCKRHQNDSISHY